MASFIFGGEGMPKTPQELARRRQIAEALAARVLSGNSAPQNVGQAIGQGLGDVGQALAARRMNSRLDKAESAGNASAAAAFNPLMAALSGTAAPSAPSMGSAAQPGAAIDNRVSQAFSGDQQEFFGGLTPAAIKASQATGVDPRIILAQAALESGYGKHAPGNNLFGIKSHGQDGGNALNTTEVVNGQPVQKQASFRAYDSPDASVMGYADFINNNPRYQAFKAADGLDAQVAALGQSGYATDPAYAQKVASIAKGIRLPQVDQTATGSVPGQPAPPLTAPQSVATPPAPPTQPMAQPGPDMQALSQQFGGSQQLAHADPRKGILSALLSGQQNGKAGFPAAPGQGNDRMRAIASVLSNPFSNEGQKAVAAALLKDELAKRDPNNALDAEYKRAQIEKLHADAAKASNPLAQNKYGLQPQYGVDENGNPVILQLGSNGQATQTRLPEGVKLSKEPIKVDLGTTWGLIDPITRQVIGTVPKDLAGAEAEKARGKAQGGLAATLPTDMLTSAQTVNQIDQLLTNPGLDSIVGPVDQYRPTWSLSSEGRDALARYNQLKGHAFLQAYTTLKGGGQITEVEGKKAEDAMARMDRAQGEGEFRTALKDFRDAVLAGQKKLLEKAGVPQDQWGRYLPQQTPSQGDGSVQINGYTIKEVQ